LVGSFAVSALAADPMAEAKAVDEAFKRTAAIVGPWEVSSARPEGKTLTAEVRTSEILKKIGGKWLCIVDHLLRVRHARDR
jgi:ketosteroid isomerase-like protein